MSHLQHVRVEGRAERREPRFFEALRVAGEEDGASTERGIERGTGREDPNARAAEAAFRPAQLARTADGDPAPHEIRDEGGVFGARALLAALTGIPELADVERAERRDETEEVIRMRM